MGKLRVMEKKRGMREADVSLAWTAGKMELLMTKISKKCGKNRVEGEISEI